MRLTLIILALTSSLLLSESAHAKSPWTVKRLHRIERIARTYWPNSPCKGREFVVYKKLDGSTLGQALTTDTPGESCYVEVDLHVHYGSQFDLCYTLAHEFGHLAGLEHTHDGGLMDPEPGFISGACLKLPA